jgi:hypothetical protein
MAVVGGADDAGNPPERINGVLAYHICHFSFYQFMVIFNYSYYIFSAWFRSERFQGLG